MSRLFRTLLLSAALATAVVLPTPALAGGASSGAVYAVTNDGILQYTWWLEPYSRKWVLIRVELYFPD